MQIAQGNIDSDIRGASKNLHTGNDHIKRGHFDSAANSFRKSMEFILRGWMYLIEGNRSDSILRGWICYKQEFKCKKLDEVKVRPADKINFLEDVGLFGKETYEQFEFLRHIGNRGSHAEGQVNKQEAKKGSKLTYELLKMFELICSEIVSKQNPTNWKKIKNAQAYALQLCYYRISKDIRFLKEKNRDALAFIERKRSYLSNHHGPFSGSREVKLEIENAKAQLRQREKEIRDAEILNLQVIQERERLLSIYDPNEYEKLCRQRADRKQQILKREERNKLLKKIAAITSCIVIAIICVFFFMYVLTLD